VVLNQVVSAQKQLLPDPPGPACVRTLVPGPTHYLDPRVSPGGFPDQVHLKAPAELAEAIPLELKLRSVRRFSSLPVRYAIQVHYPSYREG
jgi:hypothetical protein